MVPGIKSAGLWTCLVLCGCSQPTEELRNYSDSTDGAGKAAPQESVAAVPTTPTTTAEDESPRDPTSSETTAKAAATVSTTDEPPAPVAISTNASAVAVTGDRPPRVPLPEPRTPSASASATSVSTDGPTSTAREISLLVPEKDFPRIDGGKVLRVSFDDLDLLKVLNMEPVPANCLDYFPEWLKGLDGKQIRLRGFMIPDTRSQGITGFQLARDTQLCCFGRDPKPYDVIPVLLKEGTTTHYIHLRPFDVVWRFAIRPYSFRGEIENLYEIEEAELIER